jgi:hypothetical protein
VKGKLREAGKTSGLLKKEPSQKRKLMNRNGIIPLLFGEKILNMLVVYNFVIERIGSGFFGTIHFNASCKQSAFSFLQRCYYFLCHNSIIILFHDEQLPASKWG